MKEKCAVCKFSEICKIPQEKRSKCKADTLRNNKIFDRDWEEIRRMQLKQY